jgi:hypothetical protein
MHILAPISVGIVFVFIMVLNKSFRDDPGVTPAEFLNRITFRKVTRILAIVILAVAFIHTLPLDLAIIYAGDALVYFEVLTAVSVFAAQGRIRETWRLIRRLGEDWARAANKLFVAAAQKSVSHYRHAAIRAQRRKRSTDMSKKADDDADPARWGIPA